MRSLALAALLFAACGSPAPRFAPLDSDGHHFRDKNGRAVILRGINARVEGVFDVDLGPGRVPLEPIPAFGAADARRMAELGLSLLRLPINWSGVEPQPGKYDGYYLSRIARVVDLCRAEGVLVLLDMHQDAWSKEIGEDGAPLWAIEPPPEKLLEGPLDDLGERRLSPQVTKAFESFFTRNTNNLQEKFAAMLAYVAGRFVGDPAVIVYEIFNEPQATDAELLPFHTKVAEAIRTVDRGHLIAFEPTVYRNFTNSATIADAPFPDRGGVYAPHVYTAVFNDDPRLPAGTFGPALQASWRGAREEANAWQTPLLVGELGVGPTTPNGAQWIDGSLDMADETLGSTAWWLWKEESQASWGMFDKSGTGWIERSDFIKMIARPHARAIGGDPVSVRWDGTTLTVELTVKSGVEPIHDVWWYPGPAPQALCNGDAVPLEPLGYNLYQARCAGTLTVK